jgi:hypothetical protein
MALLLSQTSNADRFVSRHRMFVPIERVTQPPSSTVPYRGLITLSGVAIINLHGTSEEDWHRERVSLDLNDDVARAVNTAPWQPRPRFFFTYRIEQWVPFATVNARYNRNVANHDGTAVDSFSLEPARGAMLHADIAIRDTDAWIYRIGYQLHLYVRLEEQPVPG